MGPALQAFAAWMDSYGQAWEARDAKAAADLYAENGTYQITPFIEPMQGRTAIRECWTHVAQTEENIQFGYEILATTPEHGIARWWASFVIVPQQLRTRLDGIFVITLDDGGKCLRLQEWWAQTATQAVSNGPAAKMSSASFDFTASALRGLCVRA